MPRWCQKFFQFLFGVVACILYCNNDDNVNAFVIHPSQRTTATRHWTRSRITTACHRSSSSSSLTLTASSSSSFNQNDLETTTTTDSSSLFTHDDIIWKLRPPSETTSRWKRFMILLASNLIRWESLIRRRPLPFCLCPKTSSFSVLEAWIPKNKNKKWWNFCFIRQRQEKIGRFGITTQRGPPAPAINQAYFDLFLNSTTASNNNNNIPINVGSAAIIYMFVEPSYRKRGLGKLALQIIAKIHAQQNCDVTLLVADDDGTNSLVQWYQKEGGFKVGPSSLSTLLGSPDGQFGVAMMAPTNATTFPCRLEWW